VTDPPERIVVSDANVLINLMHVGRLDICGRLPGFKFVVPDHVREEITVPEQRSALDEAVALESCRIVTITDPEDIVLFGDHTTTLGRGESACLVLSDRYGWTVASDEKKRFRREAVARIGEDRIIGTADLFTCAIQAGLLTIEEADADKALLEERRFRMPFRSFRERVPEQLEER